MGMHRNRYQSLIVWSLLVVILIVIATVSLSRNVLADDGGPTKSPPYIYGGTIKINGLTIDEFLDSLEQYTGYLQVDVDFDFMLYHILKARGKLEILDCLLYTSPSPRDRGFYRMPSSA